MKNLTLYKDKSQTFKYNIVVEGVSISDTTSRLCLEFENGENLYFKGNINENGECSVSIPALKRYEGKGMVKIECIAENTFFDLHKSPFEIKQKVNVKINEDLFEEVVEKKVTPKFSFELVTEDDEDEEEQPEDDDEEEVEECEIKPKKSKTKDKLENTKKRFKDGKFETFKDFFNEK